MDLTGVSSASQAALSGLWNADLMLLSGASKLTSGNPDAILDGTVELMLAQMQQGASLKVLQVQDEMTESLLDILV